MTELTQEERLKRKILLKKFGEQKATKSEAEELRGILEKEKDQAAKGDSLLVFGIVFVLGLLLAYLADRKFDMDLIKKDIDNFMQEEK